MKQQLTISIDENILLRFNMALQLNGDEIDGVFDNFIKSYISKSFAKEAMTIKSASNSESNGVCDNSAFTGKALQKISRWAEKPNQITYKILRAYFQLNDKFGKVKYNDLEKLCKDNTHLDTYVPTFESNFPQMKFDSEKSYGKVFIVDEDNTIYLWNYVKDEIMKYKNDFLNIHSTDVGFININNQENIGRTDIDGTDHLQKLYMMRCNICGYEHFTNGTSIYEKKCPKCQNGVDTGSTE